MAELDFNNIKEPIFAEQASQAIEEMVANNLISEANLFAYHLNRALEKYPELKKEQPELYQRYQKLINYARFITLVGLTEDEFFDLFKNNFLTLFEILKINPFFDLIDRIRGFLVSIPILLHRNSFKKELIKRLLDNTEKITSKPIKDSAGNEVPPTIGNWLRDYQSVFGPTGSVDKVKQTEYLINSRNTKDLSNEERERLKHLINVYEFLKLDSTTPEGLEETVAFETEEGKLVVLSGGRLEEIPVPGKESSTEVEATIKPTPTIKESPVEEIKIESEQESVKVPTEETKMITEAVKVEETEKLIETKKEPAIEKKETSPVDLEIEEITKEVEKFKKETPTFKPTSLNADEIINEVIKSLELSFPDETMEHRFRNILRSYLNDVRDQLETLLVLKRPVKIGGMGFDQAKAEEILWLLKDYQEKLIKQTKEIKDSTFKEVKKEAVKPALAEGLLRPEEMITKPEEVKKEEPQPTFDRLKFEAGPLWRPKEPTTPAVKKEPVVSQAEKEEMLKILEAKEEKKPQPKPEKETVIPIRRPIGLEPEKPILADVKVKPKIYGPIEELKTLSLSEWRSWGSPEEAINRIQDKIEFLAEQSLIKKAQGIKAWQSSEVYRLYLEIGEEALEKHQPVEEIIKLREKEKRPFLTLEEFNRITELNQKLRF